jgi:hypothetical protein
MSRQGKLNATFNTCGHRDLVLLDLRATVAQSNCNMTGRQIDQRRLGAA